MAVLRGARHPAGRRVPGPGLGRGGAEADRLERAPRRHRHRHRQRRERGGPGATARPDGPDRVTRRRAGRRRTRDREDGMTHSSPPAARATAVVAVPAAIGVLVAVALGVYGRVHEPGLVSVNVAGFSSPGAVKSWLATVAFALALVQLGSALVMWGKVPGVAAPSWIGGLHRWSGRLAVLVTVPVAVHCLYALGFDFSSPRALVHSLLGCFFYGVFV